jgi:hypothetical protein
MDAAEKINLLSLQGSEPQPVARRFTDRATPAQSTSGYSPLYNQPFKNLKMQNLKQNHPLWAEFIKQ